MKKRLLIIGFMFLICNISEASKIRVLILPDKSIRHTVCPENVLRETCIADALKANPGLGGLEYEDIERKEMPDNKALKNHREVWRKVKGKDFTIDKVKEKKFILEKLIKERIKKIKDDLSRKQAIEELKSDGLLPDDY